MSLPAGVIHALVAPFDSEGRLDDQTLARLTAFHVASGAAGIGVNLPDGEQFNLRMEERKRVVEIVTQTTGGRVPVYVHVSASGTAHSVDLAQHAERAGAAGVLLSPPYYWRLSAQSQVRHFVTVGRAIGIDLLAYNLPKFNGNETIGIGIIADLIDQLPNFGGVVESSLAYLYLAQISMLFRQADRLLSFASDVEYLLPTAQMGMGSWFSSAAGVAPRTLHALFKAVESGSLETAAALQHRASRLIRALGKRTPSDLKAAFAAMERPIGAPRLPLWPLSAQARAALEQELFRWIADDEVKGWASAA